MKSLMLVLALCSLNIAFAQNYNDLFTTYKSVPSTPSKSQSKKSYNVPHYEVLDIDELNRRMGPQNVQTVTGYTLSGGQLYSIKLKVGVSGTNRNQMLVIEYWDGYMWNDANGYASPIGYGAPEQIRMVCEYEAYITGVGKVYF